jgi:hypothetical protein
MSVKPYSNAEKQWLLENVNEYSYAKLATMLCDVFGRKVRPETLCEYCRVKLGVDKRDKWGAKLGNTPGNTLPVGTERIQKNRSVYVKVGNTGDRKKDWVPKTKIIFGDIPDGKILVFLDGNSMNCVKENLCCVEQRVHARLAKNRWFFTNPTLTMTAIRWCELLYAIQDAKKVE